MFVPLVGYDKAPFMRKAQQNIEAANLSDYISINRRDFLKTKKDHPDQHLHVLTNHLWRTIDCGYRNILQTNVILKQHYQNTDVWITESSMEGLKNFGLRTSRKIKLFNGKLKAFCHQIYSGSKEV